MSIADIHVRAADFQARIRQRNLREHLVAVFLVPVFGWVGWIAPEPLVKIGAALIIAAIIYVSVRLATTARAASVRDLAHAESWVTFHRAELVRQHKALKDVWRWYISPFAPGMLLFLIGASFTADNPAPFFAKAMVFGLSLIFVGAVFAGVGWLNALAARRVQTAIDALDANVAWRAG